MTAVNHRKLKPGLSIRLKIILFSSLSISIAVITMALVLSIYFSKRFDEYISGEKEELRSDLVQKVALMLEDEMELDQEKMRNLASVYMDQGMYISLKDEAGDLLFTCHEEEDGSCCSMTSEEMETLSYEMILRSRQENALTLEISYDSSTGYSENARFFLIESLRSLIASMLISLVFSLGISFLFARSLSRPLMALSSFAQRLENRDYRAADSFRQGTLEIDQLHHSIEKLAAKLESQEELRVRLSSDISHELRTPLSRIQGTLEAMIDGVWSCDESRLSECHSEILRLETLVQQVEDLNFYSEQPAQLSWEPLDLKESIVRSAKLFEYESHKRNLIFDLSLDSCSINGDPDKLTQLWINLLSNAFKFCPDGGTISISLRKEEDITVCVTDTGFGIDEKDLPLIFERFYKTDPSRNISGSGLGLSIVAEIVKSHGGSIKVESTVEKGSSFCVTFPLSLLTPTPS